MRKPLIATLALTTLLASPIRAQSLPAELPPDNPCPAERAWYDWQIKQVREMQHLDKSRRDEGEQRYEQVLKLYLACGDCAGAEAYKSSWRDFMGVARKVEAGKTSPVRAAPTPRPLSPEVYAPREGMSEDQLFENIEIQAQWLAEHDHLLEALQAYQTALQCRASPITTKKCYADISRIILKYQMREK